MNILQIVGYKNSGKTTLVQQLIQSFTADGLQVGSLKHHGHGGVPKSIKNTDSDKHKRAGSIASGVEGGGEFSLSLSKKSWEIEELLAFYRVINLDFLVIEGFKKKEYNKIVLIRREKDLSLLQDVTNIIAVVTTVPIQLDIPVFKPSDYDKLYNWLSKNFYQDLFH